MPNLSDLLAISPQNGGLASSNYPNPYGLRAYKQKNGAYGGQMMPKGDGWLGSLKNLAYPETASTELSVGDEFGDFPLITPNLTAEQLLKVLALKEGEKPPRDIYEAARSFANQRRSKGLNPFKDIGDK